MTYREEWKGHLRISGILVFWDKNQIGKVISRFLRGAKSPLGMETNMVWEFEANDNHKEFGFQAMDQAIAKLIEHLELLPVAV